MKNYAFAISIDGVTMNSYAFGFTFTGPNAAFGAALDYARNLGVTRWDGIVVFPV